MITLGGRRTPIPAEVRAALEMERPGTEFDRYCPLHGTYPAANDAAHAGH